MTFNDLMAGPPPTHLPEDPATAELDSGTPAAEVVRAHPESPEIVEAAWFAPDSLPELQAETSGALVALGRASQSPSAPVLPPSASQRS